MKALGCCRCSTPLLSSSSLAFLSISAQGALIARVDRERKLIHANARYGGAMKKEGESSHSFHCKYIGGGGGGENVFWTKEPKIRVTTDL